jgi:hypothetical protein
MDSESGWVLRPALRIVSAFYELSGSEVSDNNTLANSMYINSCYERSLLIPLLNNSLRLAKVPDSRSSSIALRHIAFLCGINDNAFNSNALVVSMAPLSRQDEAFCSQIAFVSFSLSFSDAKESISRPNCIVSLMIALHVTSESACSANTASASHKSLLSNN